MIQKGKSLKSSYREAQTDQIICVRFILLLIKTNGPVTTCASVEISSFQNLLSSPYFWKVRHETEVAEELFQNRAEQTSYLSCLEWTSWNSYIFEMQRQKK